MIKLPERWSELQARSAYKLRPIKNENEADAVREYLRDYGFVVEHDSPVGVNDNLLVYATIANGEIHYVSR